MNILVVDDEQPARQRLVGLLDELGKPYKLVAEAANGEDAVQACSRQDIDVVLMDIRMPGMDGLSAALALSQLTTPPAVIFVTAYEEHALDAFNANAVAYLLKPVRRERLAQALSKVTVLTRPQMDALQPVESQFITATFRGGIQRIALEDVLYLRADSKYVAVRHPAGEALVEESLKSLEDRFPGRFLRIHRNALVAADKVSGLEKLTDGRCVVLFPHIQDRVEISRRHLSMVRRTLRGSR